MRSKVYIVLLSLLLSTPFMYSGDLFNGINNAKQVWFYGAMSLFLTVVAIDLLFSRKFANIKYNITDIALIAFYSFFLIRAAATPYMPIFNNQKFLNVTLLCSMYFMIRGLMNDSEANDAMQMTTYNKISSFGIQFLIITGLVEAVWGLLQLYGYRQSFNGNFKITGSFFNPAPYAIYLAVIFPLALGAFLYYNGIKKERTKKLKALLRFPFSSLTLKSIHRYIISLFLYFLSSLSRYLSLITIIAIILVLPPTMNRASWLGLAAGSAVALNYKYNLIEKAGLYLKTRIRKLAAIILSLFIISGTGIGLYTLKYGSSRGRLFIWEVTARTIKQHPVFGIGVGRFEAEYNNHQAKWFMAHPDKMVGPRGMAAGNTKYCFNEYFETAAELGIPGLLLFLTVIISAFSGIGNAQGAVRRVQCNINSFIFSLITLLVCAAVSFPFYSLPTLILFFLLLAVISSYKLPVITIVSPRSLIKPLKVTLAAALLVGSILLAIFTINIYNNFYRWDEPVMLYQTRNYSESEKSFSELFESLKFNGPLMQHYGKVLYLNGRYNESVLMLERAKNFNSDEILYCSLGDSYKACKMFNKAEESYRFASYMVPHKLYPLYLLAMLFDETGQKEKAVAVAREVLNKEIKVESEAIEEIRKAMTGIIGK